jgi:hypothetical protein
MGFPFPEPRNEGMAGQRPMYVIVYYESRAPVGHSFHSCILT